MYFFLKKNKLLTLLAVSFMIGVSIFFVESTPTSSQDNSTITPTLFIHGYKGGVGSFQTMLDRLETDGWGKKEMKVLVSPAGKVSFRGSFSGEHHPFLQVIFRENRASLDDQTRWLQEIMSKLKTDYGIKQVNLVGHSMGGLVTANLLLQQNEAYPQVDKLIVMGSPFKGIDKEEYFDINTGEALADLRSDAHALAVIAGSQDRFPQNVGVLAIAGVIDAKHTTENADKVVKQKKYMGGDGLVSLSSALGIKDIVPNENYKEKIFKDIEATHSGLHEHTGVDQAVAQFLWKN